MSAQPNSAGGPRFGRHLMPLWPLRQDATHFNHGAFGACPREVLAAQAAAREEMERALDQFFRRRVVPGGGDSAVRAAAAALASFVGTDSMRLALIENATTAMTAVLASRAFEPGDEILFTDHTYNAVRLAIEHVAGRTGAVPRKVEIPVPIRSDDILDRIVGAVTPRTRLAVIDHITSPTALVLPVAEIVAELGRRGVPVLVDGAHAVGQVPLALDALGADWYVSNAHKWLYAPKGTAFLYARPGRERDLVPLAVSHYNHFGFPECFDYVGTRDVTGWMALPAALAFVERFGPHAIMEYNCALTRRARAFVEEVGAVPIGPDRMSAAMRAYILPQREKAPSDGVAFMNRLWDAHRIQVPPAMFGGHLILRLSAQIYLDEEDFARLCDILSREGWPGR